MYTCDYCSLNATRSHFRFHPKEVFGGMCHFSTLSGRKTKRTKFIVMVSSLFLLLAHLWPRVYLMLREILDNITFVAEATSRLASGEPPSLSLQGPQPHLQLLQI